ncbi:MAG: NHLP leader peptide family RiPP precursor [Deltaproteobacteria bacterium]|nr:NHLP leader peptide family RiPP precursor [Deltaproteobacteria bacterium]
MKEQEMREQVLVKATEDEAFRASLIADPKGTVEQEYGLRFPDGYRLEVHEESETTTHMILPPASKISERDLQAVAGGFGGWSDMSDW